MAPSKADLRARLAAAPLDAKGFIATASNHTLLCVLGDGADGLAAVYKPRAGERPLWDFPSGTLCQREVAAFEVSDALGWGLVPPTVLRDGPMGPGSVQLFIPHDPERHYFVLVEDEANHDVLVRLAVFDLLVNNADRKGSHVLAADDGRLLGVDHGLTFHVDQKLRTVIWELGGSAVPEALRADGRRLAEALAAGGDLAERLGALLEGDEVAALARRAAGVAELAALPDVPRGARPYPWPPL